MLQQKFTSNLNKLLGINIPKKIAIAVSGGADSVALFHLTTKWVHANNIQITVFSVDHNLRQEAKSEVAYVEKLAKEWGADFVPLLWDCDGNERAIQERARKARYDLITQYCRKLGIKVLLTAHHLDDHLETYLIKKSKKSSQMALKPNITYFWDDIWVARPLFDITKQELVDYLRVNKITWFEDASNLNDKYERNRVRKKLNSLSVEQRSELLLEYNLAIEKAEKLNDMFVKALAEGVSIYNEGFAKIAIEKFNLLTDEIKIHLLNYVLAIIGGKTIIPRYRNLKRIIEAIGKGEFKAATLGGCCLRLKSREIVVFVEEGGATSLRGGKGYNPSLRGGRRPTWQSQEVRVMQVLLPEIVTAPSEPRNEVVGYSVPRNDVCILLNDRFEITIAHAGDYTISYLTLTDYTKLKKKLDLTKLAKDSNNNHKSILFTLPVIKNLEKVVAIPHISYYDTLEYKDIKVNFRPNFISRFTHFF